MLKNPLKLKILTLIAIEWKLIYEQWLEVKVRHKPTQSNEFLFIDSIIVENIYANAVRFKCH